MTRLSVCEKCPEGTISQAGATECIPCDVGYYSADPTNSGGDSICLPCAPGAYTDKPSSSECKPCPAGFYSAAPGSSSCSPCEVRLRICWYLARGFCVPCSLAPTAASERAHAASATPARGRLATRLRALLAPLGSSLRLREVQLVGLARSARVAHGIVDC